MNSSKGGDVLHQHHQHVDQRSTIKIAAGVVAHCQQLHRVAPVA